MNSEILLCVKDLSHIENMPYKVYQDSVHKIDDSCAFMVGSESEDWIIASAALDFSGKIFSSDGKKWTKAMLDHKNADRLRQLFPFTVPTPVLGKKSTIGLGDRLGIATPGHIRAIKEYDVYPIFAQQSMRELALTGRSFEDVLDCASYAVFRENYTKGFGADGDHLKTPEEVSYALSCGYTMITLDCSEYIHNEVSGMSEEMIAAAYQRDAALEEKYVGKTFDVGGHRISYSLSDFQRAYLIYHDAIEFAKEIYDRFFAANAANPDFEISIDETATPTEPAQHFFIANELISAGVKVKTIAPRFCGEFQKGIDYIGNLDEFEKHFSVHAAIAHHFGYKVSVHSGSDKFSVFPVVGKYTGGTFHVKTAGTNWLEAMKIVAEKSPELYREVHTYAREKAFSDARSYYHVTTDLNRIPALSAIQDEALPALFQNNDCRQMIHITYGRILTEKDEAGRYVFRDRLLAVWREFEEEYSCALQQHIGKHLSQLFCEL